MSPVRFRQVSLLALLALGAIVLTGAAVRLTGSGLGCSDWPGCESRDFVPETSLHPWIEFGNRLVTGVVSVAVIAAVLGSYRRRPYRRDLVRWSWGLVVGVLAQIVVGALAVIWELPAGIVMVHFLLSMVLVWNATELWLRSDDDSLAPRRLPPTPLGRLVRAIALATPVILLTGTVVTAAGPHRGDPDVEPLDVAISSVARLHGIAVLCFVGLVAVAMALAARDQTPGPVRHALEVTMAVLVAQGTVGYVQYFTDVPAGLVAVHVVGATATVVAITRLVHTARVTRPATAPEPAEAVVLS